MKSFKKTKPKKAKTKTKITPVLIPMYYDENWQSRLPGAATGGYSY